MNFNEHLIFLISSIFFIKNYGFFKYLSKEEWVYLYIGGILTFSLPDIDHPNSFIGSKIKFISKLINKKIGHRKFTHSLLILIILNYYFKKIVNLYFTSNSLYYGMIIGYITHIILDLFTPMGVEILWPLNFKFKISIYYFIKIIKYIIIMLLYLLLIFLILKLNVYYIRNRSWI
ncbi:membrane protein [endosymbiont of Sipalinus gigas]|uniref:metal-dependent hydrolase n=1 Tax=endosymbiont of Sipalinus gigas TaxID=1972134 RepID=UPI000DC6F2FF|nr:metal-dependent hydrolase [endosymbiont of Sipalinus gigas]BBA85227.1 membrane protein [endosymbiont of Sipalinus gigas]